MISQVHFNFKQFALKNQCNETALANWLKQKNFHFSLTKTVLLNRVEHKQLLSYAKLGITNSFQHELTNTVKSIVIKINKTKKEILKIEQEILNLTKLVSQVESSIPLKKVKNFKDIKSLTTFTDTQSHSFSEELKKKNKEYFTSKSKLTKLLEQEKRIVVDTKIRETKIALEKKAKKVESQLSNTQLLNKIKTTETKASINNLTNSTPKLTSQIEWSDIRFNNGYISIKLKGKWLEKFYISSSKESLNSVKSIYKFKKAPKIEIEVEGYRIKKINNIEVLEYYITFLSFADSFDKKLLSKQEKSVSKFKGYTKGFYEQHFPNIFLSKCFSYLCKSTLDNLPIIPIPETVINANGQSHIDDSFLFPIAKSNKIVWVWESIEQSKASYIFRTGKLFEIKLQEIFDFLTGDIVNKRQNLISNQNVSIHLGLEKRVFHKEENSWKLEIKNLK